MGKNPFLFIIFINLINFIKTLDCPKRTPIKYNNDECSSKYCTEEEFNNSTCVIANQKAEMQWINTILTNEYKKIYSLGIAIYNNKSLLSILSYTEIDGEAEYCFFSINSDYNDLTLKTFNITLKDSYIGYIDKLVLLEINNKLHNYLLTCVYTYCELINYSKKEIQRFEISEVDIYDLLLTYSLFKLNDNNNFLIALLIDDKTWIYLSLTKFNFTVNEENNSIESNYINKNFISEQLHYFSSVSCFQTDNNLIECMVTNLNNDLCIFIFNDDLELKSKIIIDNNPQGNKDLKCIHLRSEIGIYNYQYNGDYYNAVLKIKELIYNERTNIYQLIDIFNSSNLININFDNKYDRVNDFELLKISNNRFVNLYSLYNQANKFLLIVLYDLYGSNGSSNNLIGRYYKMSLTMYNINTFYIFGFEFNNHIGVAFYENYPIVIIFGYNENKETDIIENLNNINGKTDSYLNYSIILKEYINNYMKINNNLFSYEFIGIKIEKLVGISSGIKYFLNSDTNILIHENEMLKVNDIITIDYSDINAKINEEFYLSLLPLFGFSEFDKYNSSADYIEQFGEEDAKDFFEKLEFTGESFTIKYNFGCHKDCETCEYVGVTLSNQRCLSCRSGEGYCYMENENNCFHINSVNYKYYINENGTLICVPLGLSCPDNYPFEDKNTRECKSIIRIKDLVLENHIYSKNEIEKIIQIFYNEIQNNKNLTVYEDIILFDDDYSIQITTTERQKFYINNKDIYNNISSINLNECEDLLKKEYNITSPLIIMKIDLKRNDTPSTQVEYQIINPENNEILDLSKCDNIPIDIYAPTDFNQSFSDLIKHIKEQGYDIFNINDTFYTEICSPYRSVNNTDVILRDRRIDFYDSNMTLCEDTCQYISFDVTTFKVNCKCNIKTKINLDTNIIKFSAEILFKKFYDLGNYTNYKVLKCYDLVFDLYEIKHNIGSYALLSILFLFILLMILNFITQRRQFEQILGNIISLNLATDKILNKNKGIIVLNKIKKRNKKNKKVSFSKTKENENNINNEEMNVKEINENNEGNNEENNKENNEEIKEEKNYELFSINNGQEEKNIKEREKASQIYMTNISNNDIYNENNDKSENIYKTENPPSRKTNNRIKVYRNSKKSKSNRHLTQFELSANNNQKGNSGKISPKSINISQSQRNLNFDLSSLNQKNINSKTINAVNINAINSISPIEGRKNNYEIKANSQIEEMKRIYLISKKIPKFERHEYFIDNELNGLAYQYAIEIDFRTFFESYWSLLKQNHLLLFTFISKNDYNLFLHKLSLVLISFALSITINTLFFTDKSMHQLYVDYGKFDVIYNIPQTIYSIIISSLFTTGFEYLSLSEDLISKFKEIENINEFNKIIVIKCLIIKSAIYSIVGVIILLFFWYYVTCFCSVYYNTQIPLIKDTIISYSYSMIYPFFLSFIPVFIRIPALRAKSIYLYKISRILCFVISLI